MRVTRIIAGTLGGRRIATPTGMDTRPTSDRVREALFSRLEHEVDLQGARVLDLFAGSGALGLEAASRGAGHVVLVECAERVVSLLRSSVTDLDVGDRVQVRASKAATLLVRPPQEGYDVVFLDPPYPLAEEALAHVLRLLDDGRWLSEQAVVVVERSSRSPEPRWPAGLSRFDQRTYGETVLWWAESARGENDDDVA